MSFSAAFGAYSLGAGGGGGAAGAGADATVATGRFGHPVSKTARTRHDSRTPTALNLVCMCVRPPRSGVVPALVLEDLARTHGDRVEPPPVLLPRILDVRAVDLRVRAVLVVAHREEPVLTRRKVRVVRQPHVPVLSSGAARTEKHAGYE